MTIKVDTVHPGYQEMVERWTRCRHASEGLDAVRKAKSKYLPKLTKQNDPDYKAYLTRADFYGAMGRSIQGHSGSVFRKPPKIEVPGGDKGEEWLEDMTLTGISAEGLMLEALRELLEVGRYGLYVDMAEKGEGDNRPYIILVAAENIISWRTENVNGKQVLNRVVLCEHISEDDPEDMFKVVEVVQYRVLELAATDDEGMGYTQTLYRKNKNGDDFEQYGEAIMPDRRGKTFDRIPFWFGNASNITPNVERPPLMEVADLCLSMWRNSADLENGFHYVGIPTPWVAGFPIGTELRIGSNVAWVSDKTDAKASMLEFTGQGLKGLSEHIDSKKRDCAVFGSRLLEEQKKSAETAETVRLRHAGEVASLMSMVETLDKTFSEALEFAYSWGGLTGETTVAVNRDLLAIKASPQELQALTAAVQAGLMSFETYYYNLEQLELTRPEVDFEEEDEAIQNNADKEVVLKVAGGRPADEDEEAKAARLAEEAKAA